jgi:uncharacterized protein (TIGR03382 family)
MLGLDHVCTGEFGPAYNQPPICPVGASPIMKPQVGSASSRALDQDDVNGICSIYPKGGATLTCPPVQSKKSSGGGCNSSGGAGILALAGVLEAWRRRRRPRR